MTNLCAETLVRYSLDVFEKFLIICSLNIELFTIEIVLKLCVSCIVRLAGINKTRNLSAGLIRQLK